MSASARIDSTRNHQQSHTLTLPEAEASTPCSPVAPATSWSSVRGDSVPAAKCTWWLQTNERICECMCVSVRAVSMGSGMG